MNSTEMRVRLGAVLIALLLLSTSVFAGETANEKEPAAIPEPRSFVSEHRGTFNGVTLRYTATAGETYLRDEEGKPKASIFSFAYLRTDTNG
ncbi:MAG: hypothetical protein KDI09_22650, partial [Halioglobus sp.]|nr:hypothetical protein [Halioglobus sp.]